MVKSLLRRDPFFNSIFLKHFYNHFLIIGKYYKLFNYLIIFNKLLKKKGLTVFILISFIIKSYFMLFDIRSKFLSKKKKKKKKFKNKKNH